MIVVAYWEPPKVVVRSVESPEQLPTDGVLWIWTPKSGRVAGRDHYWIEDDGSIGYAHHHDYDAANWEDTHIEPNLPGDRPVLNGRMAPDEIAREEGIIQ